MKVYFAVLAGLFFILVAFCGLANMKIRKEGLDVERISAHAQCVAIMRATYDKKSDMVDKFCGPILTKDLSDKIFK